MNFFKRTMECPTWLFTAMTVLLFFASARDLYRVWDYFHTKAQWDQCLKHKPDPCHIGNATIYFR